MSDEPVHLQDASAIYTGDHLQGWAVCGAYGRTSSHHELKRGGITCAECLAEHARRAETPQTHLQFPGGGGTWSWCPYPYNVPERGDQYTDVEALVGCRICLRKLDRERERYDALLRGADL